MKRAYHLHNKNEKIDLKTNVVDVVSYVSLRKIRKTNSQSKASVSIWVERNNEHLMFINGCQWL